MASIQKLPAASVLTDINFPMKGRKGMVDWARNSEDRVVIPKNIFTPMSTGKAYQYFNFVLALTRKLRIFVSQDYYIIWNWLFYSSLKERLYPQFIPEREDGALFQYLEQKVLKKSKTLYLWWYEVA